MTQNQKKRENKKCKRETRVTSNKVTINVAGHRLN